MELERDTTVDLQRKLGMMWIDIINSSILDSWLYDMDIAITLVLAMLDENMKNLEILVVVANNVGATTLP